MKHLYVLSLLIINFIVCSASDIFDVHSKTTFHSSNSSNYFGYSVALSKNGLLVGAPKSTRVNDSPSSGDIFTCQITHTDHHTVNCENFPIQNLGFLTEDMLFGASIAVTSDDKYIFCAPRWTDRTYNALNGACYLDNILQKKFLPMNNTKKLFYDGGGARKNYPQAYRKSRLNFYLQGLVGISVKIAENNKLIVGAPGLMMWTGGIVEYQLNPRIMRRNPTNSYFTKELGPDEYFGYSVESGIFEVKGSVLYVAGAPRSKMGYGQVLVFQPPLREAEPLRIRAKVQGPQLGSYFGASLCCTDLNGDGKADLLVGAPNFVIPDSEDPVDQGAVFVYLAGGDSPKLVLKEAGFVSGAAATGARFGSAIAALGDVDGDGFNDIAVGAPGENNGVGAVYIYRGNARGIEKEYSQKIQEADAKGFGFSISKGVDVDDNNCNDLAVGAYNSATAYVFRCIPTITVNASIIVPNNYSIHQNSSNFTAYFCVTVKDNKFLPGVKIDFKANIKIEKANHTASLLGETEFNITVTSGKDVCYERVVEIIPSAHPPKQILLKFALKENTPMIDIPTTFNKNQGRQAKNSNLHSAVPIKVSDCGSDHICNSWLIMALEPYKKKYTPGTNDTIAVVLTIFNRKEPAYDAQLILRLPLPPKRIPTSCSLEGLNMTCAIHSPLRKDDDTVVGKFQLEYSPKVADKGSVMIVAELKSPDNRNTKDAVKNVTILITPVAKFRIYGKSEPESTMTLTSDTSNVYFTHNYEILNLGPSDWHTLKAVINLPQNVNLSRPVPGCECASDTLTCAWALPAKQLLSLTLPFKYDLEKYGEYLEHQTNVQMLTTLTLLDVPERQSLSLTTSLRIVQDPLSPLVIYFYSAASIAGFMLLSANILLLDMCGFFKREHYEKLKRLKDGNLAKHKSAGSSKSSRNTKITKKPKSSSKKRIYTA